MKQVVNDALRRALQAPVVATTEPYRLTPHESAVRPGVDLSALNRLADEVEDELIMERARRPS